MTPESLLLHDDFIRALARSLSRDEEDALDTAQETWLAAMRRPPREDGTRSWLATVARNALSQIRRASARRALTRRARRATGASRLGGGRCRARAAAPPGRRGSLGIGEPTRAVVLARFFDAVPPREIATRMGLPVETVRSRLKRGLARLRERLADEWDGDESRRAHALATLAGPAAVGAFCWERRRKLGSAPPPQLCWQSRSESRRGEPARPGD